MKNLINKGPAHCWSETMHQDYWNKMRQRTSGIAGRGGGNDIALKDAKEKRGPAKKKTSCWTGYSNIVKGKPTFKKKGKRMVPDCKPIGKKK
tara:strand:- start:15 stop:290 length:276 start_codon:yes stop_codon:yes gene_type:complete